MTITKTAGMTVVTVRRGVAFTGGGQGYRATVDGDGAVLVWDSVAGHWTRCHALTARQEQSIRRAVNRAECPASAHARSGE